MKLALSMGFHATQIAAALVGFCILCLAARADQPDMSLERLTVTRAVQIALDHNPSVQQTREHLNELNADVSTAWSTVFPTLSAMGTANHQKAAANSTSALFGGQPYNYYTMGFSASQPIWASGAISGGIGVAHSNLKLGGLSDEIARRTLVLNVVTSFYDLLLNQRKLDTLLKEEQVDQALVKTTDGYYRVGRSQLLDLLQTKTTLALLSPQIATARNAVFISATQLATYLGNRNAREVEVQGVFDDLVDRARLEQDLRAKKLRILEIEQAEEQFNLLESTRTLNLAKDLPYLSAVATWGRNSYVKTDLLTNDSTAWTLGLQLSVPLFSGLSSVHARHMYASQEIQLQMAKENTLNTTTLAQVQALKTLDTAEDQIRTSLAAFDLAKQSLKEAEHLYKLGTATLIQYQTSQQSLLTAQLTLDQARHDYIVDFCQYAVAMGYPTAELVAQLEKRP